MLCDKEFVASDKSGYNKKWGVVFNNNIVNGKMHGENHLNWPGNNSFTYFQIP